MSNIIFYVVFGLIAGTIANLIDKNPSQGGILGSIVLGIVGAVVGGFLGEALFGVGVTGFNITSFLVAVVGSLLVLWLARMMSRNRAV